MRTLPKNFVAANGATPVADPVSPVAPLTAGVVTAPIGDWPGRELMADPMLARILLAVWSGDPLCVTPAAPGSGKSRLATLLAAALAHRAGLRVGVAAQTREQALELARRMSAISDRYALIVSAATAKSGGVNGVRTVTGGRVRWSHPTGGAILIGTAARWLYVDPSVGAADVLLIDEAWQATYADAGALGALARQVVLVGDSGQIAPVVTGSTARWEGQPTGPHQSAPAALLAAHGSAATVHELTSSWRLGPKTCSLLSEHFYRQMPFTSRRPDEAVVTDTGSDLSEIACLPVKTRNGPTDPVLMEALAERVRDLLGYQYRRGGQSTALRGEDIAVVVPHVAQAGAVRALLSDIDGVMIGTSNGLQGQERPAVVALHPMAGYRQVQSFAVDPGRTCVTLSRHRGHMTLVTDPATVGLLAGDDDPMAAAALLALEAVMGID